MAEAALRTIRDLPGPKQIPIFGNALQLDLRQMHLNLERWSHEYGPLFQMRILKQKIIVTRDPVLSEAIHRARPDTWRRAILIETYFEEMGLTGVFSAEGEEWRSQRRLAMEALATKHLRGFYTKLAGIIERMVRRWEKAADEHRILDLTTELKLLTVDVTTLLVFGHDIDTLSKDAHEDVIQDHLEVFFPAFHRRLNALVPYWRLFKLPQDYRLDRAIVGITTWINKQIEVARKRLAEDPTLAEKPENFIQSMLLARDAEGKPFTDRVVMGNALTMLLAGEDTTAHSIAWAVHHLLEEREARTKLREELTRVLGDRMVPDSLEQSNALAYTAGVANEAMRLRSVAPFQFFDARKDVVLGDLKLPRGASVCTLTRAPTLEDEHFADAKAFKPERWIAGERTGAHNVSSFLPFGSGPRICPGRALALLEMKMALAAIYQRFEIERVGQPRDVKEITAFAMMPDGLRVRVRRRIAGKGRAAP